MPPASPDSPSSLIGSLEEAMHLLRRCEVSAWAWWFAGTCPFTIGAIFFIHDMSRSADASLHLPVAALWLAVAYWWMMLSHAIFADRLLRELKDESIAPSPSLRGRLRFIASQAFIPATAPWILTIAFLAMLPFGWTYAAYQNFNVLALSFFRKNARSRELVQEAFIQSRYRPAQNHGLLLLLPALAMLVWINILTLIINTAALARYFTGDENPISRNPLLMVSSGVLGTTLLATYVILGPLIKALYVLRCFKSLSQRNGDDLVVAFKRAATAGVRVCAIVWMVTVSTIYASAQDFSDKQPDAMEKTTLQASALQESLQHTLKQSAYQWRLPKGIEPDSAQHGWLNTLVQDLATMLDAIKNAVANFFERLLTAKLKAFFKKIWTNSALKFDALNPSTPWADMVQRLLKWLLAALGIVVGALVFTHWKKRHPATSSPSPSLQPPMVDLEDEQVLPTQLQESEWVSLAAAKQTQGDNRLAMRALFLASLAHLGERKLVHIERSKSNGDYLRELSWRARERLELRRCFSQTILAFEQAWYGMHPVEYEDLEAYRATHQRILSDGISS